MRHTLLGTAGRSRPYVTVHVAQSLDGRVALAGRTTALSTKEGLASAHAARASHDAVLVGASTVRIDDPRLTVREVSGPHPLRVVLSSSLMLPRGANVLARDGRAIVIAAEGRVDERERIALEAAGACVEVVRQAEGGQVCIESALAVLMARGVKRLLVEGGPKIVTSFLRAKRVDRMSVEIAMTMLGAPGTPLLGALGVDCTLSAPRLTNIEVERLGDNLIVHGDVTYA